MSAGFKLTGMLMAGVLCLPVALCADTQTVHRVHKVKKQPAPPPPLPSGTQGPVPQIPLDAIPAVAPQVNYQDGMLTIIAPNSTLGDILRSVKKHTSAEIEIPSTASERVATHLGPGPVRDVMAELLNGSHFNYVLLGSAENANQLVRVVLVAKTPETPAATSAQTEANASGGAPVPAQNAVAEAADADPADEAVDDSADQAADADQQVPADQPGVKTPQQMLQEMQQRQLQLQQQQQGGQPIQPGQPGYPPPGMPLPGRPIQPQQPPQPQEQQ
jgi:hypothetical protein